MVDVVIVGGGVVGSCIAREISRYQLNTLVLEKGSDVASGSSKANSGIVHEGYDAKPGTLKARFNVEGQKMFEALSEELDFPFKRCGSLVVAFEEDAFERLEEMKVKGEKNGLTDLSVIGHEELKKLEPNISDIARAALVAPSGGIVCPYEMTIAFAENAAENGVKFQFDTIVTTVEKTPEGFSITTESGEVIQTKVLINAAGLFSDEINNMLSQEKIEIVPRRGEYCLLDKTEGDLVRHTLFQLPTKMGKGILLTPTVDGNILVGPTSEDISDKTDLSTTMAGLEKVLKVGGLCVDGVPAGKVITSFTGLRAHCTRDDFIIEEAPDVKGLINVCGIESPGLTSAPAIAKEVERILKSLLHPEANPGFNPVRKAPPRFRHLSSSEQKKLIEENPDYGRIICRCETVTKAEILAALRSPLAARDLDAVKRRTRTGMGRCQGGFCSMKMLDIISEELGMEITEVTKFGGKSNLLLERNKTGL